MDDDKSNGYEPLAHEFIRRRSRTIGATTVKEWSRALPRNASVLELGCGSGVPISQVLADEGFALYAVDASATLLEAYRTRFPDAHVECAAVEESALFNRTFDGIVAWGLMFLLPAENQRLVIEKAARALASGGKFLFTSGAEAGEWPDVMTRLMSVSLGADEYRAILRSHGLTVEGELKDEGENHYYFAARP